jgi:hydroxyacylglutathione hydrolase
MIEIKSFTFNPFAENTYVLLDTASKEAVVIDPGCYEAEEQQMLAAYIESKQLKVTKLLNTHAHIDHVLGNAWVKEKYKVDLHLHPSDNETLRAVETYAPSYGFNRYAPSTPDVPLKEGEPVKLGEEELEVLFVPGHAPGHVAFYHAGQQFCINGDCLFQGSIGRTDLPGGDFDTLISSIRSRLFQLPDETVVYCGHGSETTIGHEKKYNPFCKV